VRDGQLALLSDFHARDALVPALNDLGRAQLEVEGFAAIERAVELRSFGVGERSDVVDGHRLAGNGFGSRPGVHDLNLQ